MSTPSLRYYWTRQEEAKLVELWKAGTTNPEVLAKQLNRKPAAIQKKLGRLGVVVVQQKNQPTTTNEITTSEKLPTHEAALKLLAGALEVLQKPGLDKLELQRSRILVDALQRYDSVLEKFERWDQIENRILEMDKKIAELQKIQKVQS